MPSISTASQGDLSSSPASSVTSGSTRSHKGSEGSSSIVTKKSHASLHIGNIEKVVNYWLEQKRISLNYLCNYISRKKYVSIINEFLLPSSILENEKFINFCRYLKNHHFFFLYSWPTSNMEYIQKIT